MRKKRQASRMADRMRLRWEQPARERTNAPPGSSDESDWEHPAQSTPGTRKPSRHQPSYRGLNSLLPPTPCDCAWRSHRLCRSPAQRLFDCETATGVGGGLNLKCAKTPPQKANWRSSLLALRERMSELRLKLSHGIQLGIARRTH